MVTNPWDVMRELAVMQDRMNRIWGNVRERGRDDVTSRGAWLPPIDIYETGSKDIVLRVELPGLERKDIDLSVEDGTLTIRGERKRDDGVAEDRYHRLERTCGGFSRSITLPGTVDAGRARAEYRDGVLTVTLPAREEARPRQIEVSVAAE